MDFALSDEQRAFQAAARDFARAELAPHAARWDADAHFPLDVIRKAGRSGHRDDGWIYVSPIEQAIPLTPRL